MTCLLVRREPEQRSRLIQHAKEVTNGQSRPLPLPRFAWPRVLAGMLLAGVALAGCTPSRPDAPVGRFGELRLGGTPRAPAASPAPSPGVPPALSPTFAQSDEPPPLRRRAAPELRPRLQAPVEPAPVLPVSLDAAAARVALYLGHAGFALEQQADGTGRLVSGTRMGAPSALAGEAVCGLEALHRPDISSTELTVRLTPAPGGVTFDARAAFVEIDTKLLSGSLARQTCRSRGVLEAAVRRAALGS